jgi:hypothetical protein
MMARKKSGKDLGLVAVSGRARKEVAQLGREGLLSQGGDKCQLERATRQDEESVRAEIEAVDRANEAQKRRTSRHIPPGSVQEKKIFGTALSCHRRRCSRKGGRASAPRGRSV